jgi:hypothetical protein
MQKTRQASEEIELHWEAEKGRAINHPAFLKSPDSVRT